MSERAAIQAEGWAGRPLRAAAALAAGLALALGLPALGAWWAGRDLAALLHYPPIPLADVSGSVSVPVLVGGFAFVAAVVGPFVLRVLASRRCAEREAPAAMPRRSFPWWGWTALAAGVAAWSLAWTRVGWFAPLQRHTYTPLWLAYIVTVNALSWRRSGRCLMLDRPRSFLALFPLSAVFWWFFEYVNRFAGNWVYLGVEGFSAAEYAIFASVSFSTVLPAVASTEELLATRPGLTRGLDAFATVRPLSRMWTIAFAALCAAALVAVAWAPRYAYPLVWLAPMGLLFALERLAGVPTPLAGLARGDWARVVRLALAALVCGFFWEMWNVFSLAKWIYRTPFVQALHVFEMPLLGFAGYLPFGLACGAAADWILSRRARDRAV
jgi:hypothetical protein